MPALKQVLAPHTPLPPDGCSVCGAAFATGETVAVCDVDAAIHHPDCWQWNGDRCGTPGCAGQGALVDPAAPPPAPPAVAAAPAAARKAVGRLVACPQCGRRNPPRWRFCPDCGYTPAAPAGPAPPAVVAPAPAPPLPLPALPGAGAGGPPPPSAPGPVTGAPASPSAAGTGGWALPPAAPVAIPPPSAPASTATGPIAPLPTAPAPFLPASTAAPTPAARTGLPLASPGMVPTSVVYSPNAGVAGVAPGQGGGPPPAAAPSVYARTPSAASIPPTGYTPPAAGSGTVTPAGYRVPPYMPAPRHLPPSISSPLPNQPQSAPAPQVTSAVNQSGGGPVLATARSKRRRLIMLGAGLLTPLPIFGCALFLIGLMIVASVLTYNSSPRDGVCFGAGQPCVKGAFLAVWQLYGGTTNSQTGLIGWPLGGAQSGANNLTVQRFENFQMEEPPGNQDPAAVSLTQLGTQLLQQRGPLPGPATRKPDPNCRFIQATRHNLCGAFRTYWENIGRRLATPVLTDTGYIAVGLLGYPIGEEEQLDENGQVRQVQWFERARLELLAGQVVPAQLGLEARAPAETTPIDIPPPASPAPAGGDSPSVPPAPPEAPTSLPPQLAIESPVPPPEASPTPGPPTVPAETPTAVAPPPAAINTRTPTYQEYSVRPGDSPTGIAQSLWGHLDWWCEIKRKDGNPLNGRTLYIGDVLLIPVSPGPPVTPCRLQ